MAQETRMMAVQTPLKDDLRLISFSGREEMSRLFTYHLEMVSPKETIAPEKIVGKKAAIRIFLADGTSERYFSGVISRFTTDFAEGGGTLYRAELVPSLWLLTQTSDCRIFQDKTVPDIIKQVFKDAGFTDFETNDLRGDYRKLEYCVQFRETDFNFVSRLMEQEGIFFFFRHEEDKDVLVLADHVGAYQNLPENKVKFPPSRLANRIVVDHITDWRHDYEFISGKWSQTDYNFKKPSTSLMADESTGVPVGETKKYEVYDFPGEYVEKSEGKTLIRLRMEEEEAAFDQASGASSCRTFGVGGKFQFDEYIPPGEDGKTYVITSIQHMGQEAGTYGTDSGGSGGAEYSNSFVCAAADVPVRPARITPKPLVSGIQSAVVVGPKGEEIYCDEYGRVKVQFHWDREVENNKNKSNPFEKRPLDKSSCWIRVSHSVAGKKWGSMAIPRIGQEVIVDFLNGDPDQPLIVGSVYNQEQMPHYDLPEHNAKSYIKTNSTKGGEGFNEINFDDKAGEERLYMHAQKDMDVAVLNDSNERIYANRSQIIGWEKDGQKGGDQMEMVWQDKHLNIKRDQVEQIEGNYYLTVGCGDADDGGNLDVLVEKNLKMKVGPDGTSSTNEGDSKNEIQGDLSLSVGGDQKIKDGAYSHASDMDMDLKAGMKFAVDAGMDVHLKAGMTAVMEGGMGVTIKCGGSFITLSAAGIFISGPVVMINSGGAALSGPGSSPKSPDSPDAPEQAEPTEPKQAHTEKTGYKSPPDWQ